MAVDDKQISLVFLVFRPDLSTGTIEPRARMSADELDLQAQVEAILGTLVRAASVELIKLFESRFRASASGPDATQRAGGKGGSEVTDSLSSGGAKRSVGVQVEPDCVGMSGLPVLRRDSMNPDALHAPELQLRAPRWFICIYSRKELRNVRPFKSLPHFPQLPRSPHMRIV